MPSPGAADRGTLERWLERAYARGGIGYAVSVGAFVMVSILVVTAVSGAGGALTLDGSWDEFWTILWPTEIAVAVAMAATVRIWVSRVKPALRWVRGDRSVETAEAALQAASATPTMAVVTYGLLYVPIAIGWSVAATSVYDTGLSSFPLLLLAPMLIFASVGAIVMAALRLFVRPVVRELVEFLGPRAAVPPGRIGLLGQVTMRIASVAMMSSLLGVAVALITDEPLARYALIFTLGPALIGALCAVAGASSLALVGPVRDLMAANQRVADGDLSVQVPVLTGDELGELSRSFNDMVARLYETDDELRASRTRIVAAADAERRRVERNIHDGAQQRLVSLALDLAMLEEAADSAGADDLREMAATSRATLRHALDELRELARGLHPSVLASDGLRPALDQLIANAPIPVRVTASRERYPEAVEATAYFVACEALANVAKYAKASKAEVSIQHQDGRLVIEISDDGIGGANVAAGSGLEGLADRVAALDGALRIVSPDGAGTRITVELPLEEVVA